MGLLGRLGGLCLGHLAQAVNARRGPDKAALLPQPANGLLACVPTHGAA
jgi:hypothetical protein